MAYKKRSFKTRKRNGYKQYKSKRSGWKYTHRRVAEKKLGGKIRKGYHVHHKNGNKSDNRPSNLKVMSASAHNKLHKSNK